MKRDIAERFAATVEDDITIKQAQAIIREFLSLLGRCPLCDDTGTFTFGRALKLMTEDSAGHDGERVIQSGQTTSCPICGGHDERDRHRGDPEHVAWYCAEGHGERNCGAFHGNSSAESHSKCGYRLMLPLDLAASDESVGRPA